MRWKFSKNQCTRAVLFLYCSEYIDAVFDLQQLILMNWSFIFIVGCVEYDGKVVNFRLDLILWFLCSMVCCFLVYLPQSINSSIIELQCRNREKTKSWWSTDLHSNWLLRCTNTLFVGAEMKSGFLIKLRFNWMHLIYDSNIYQLHKYRTEFEIR